MPNDTLRQSVTAMDTALATARRMIAKNAEAIRDSAQMAAHNPNDLYCICDDCWAETRASLEEGDDGHV